MHRQPPLLAAPSVSVPFTRPGGGAEVASETGVPAPAPPGGRPAVCLLLPSVPTQPLPGCGCAGWAGGELACLCLLPPLLTATSPSGHVPTHPLGLAGPPCPLPPLSTLPPRAPGPPALRCLPQICPPTQCTQNGIRQVWPLVIGSFHRA